MQSSLFLLTGSHKLLFPFVSFSVIYPFSFVWQAEYSGKKEKIDVEAAQFRRAGFRNGVSHR